MQELKSQFIVKANMPNKNNRIYSKEILRKIVEDFEKLPDRTLMGQLGMSEDSVVHLANVSHLVKDLYLSDQDELLADIEVMNTPSGAKLVDMIDQGNVVFRMQGVGNAESVDGNNVIQENYKMITINAILAEDAS